MTDAKVASMEKGDDKETTPLVHEHREDTRNTTFNVVTSKKRRNQVYAFLLLVVLIDSVGPLVLGTAEAALIGGEKSFPNQAFTTPPYETPFPFTLSKALLQSVNMLGVTFSSICFVSRADKIGIKNTLLLFMFGGAIIFLATVFIADVSIVGGAAYPLYLLCKFLMGVFGGSAAVVSLMIQSIYTDPKEQVAKTNALMPLKMLAATIGGIAGSVAIGATGRLLSGAYVAMGLSLLGGLIVLIKVPEPPKREKPGTKGKYKKDDDAPKPIEEEKMPVGLYKNVMWASVFDSIGTNGLFSGLSLVMFQRFSIFKTNPTLVGMSVSLLTIFIVLGLAFAIPSLKKRGAGFNAVFGNFATMVGQILLIFIFNWVLFLLVLYIAFSCSFFSTVAYMPMLIEITPPSQRAKMQGTYGATSALVGCFMPIVIAVVTDYAGGEIALAVCAFSSFVGFILSMPLRKRFGAPVKKIKMTEEEAKFLKDDPNYYEKEELQKVNWERMDKGESPLRLRWGTWEHDKKYRKLLRKVAHRDFLKVNNLYRGMMDTLNAGGDAAKKMEEGAMAAFNGMIDEHKNGKLKDIATEMGHWIADYLIDNGYTYTTDPTLYKVILMSTFPHKPTQQDGASFKEMIPANINWIDRMVNFEKANPDNEYQTITKHFKHSFT